MPSFLQSQNIVSTHILTRYLDYDIDYSLRTLLPRAHPEPRRQLQPDYIVAEYESADPIDSKANFAGGRGSLPKPVRTNSSRSARRRYGEGTVELTGNLTGFDATYLLSEQTKVRAELAGTLHLLIGNVSSGQTRPARNNVIMKQEGTAKERICASRAAASAQRTGTVGRSLCKNLAGCNGPSKLNDTTLNSRDKGQAYQQDNLTTGAKNTVLKRVSMKRSAKR